MLGDARARGLIDDPETAGPLPSRLRTRLARLDARVGTGVDEDLPHRGLIALSGMIGFELTGQFADSVDHPEGFFAHTVERMADFVGLRHDR